ncbi:class I SAM-dependent methyltransferase [Planomonospora parontospora]|uniref:class I SAM-dependent methyltransferase n=1 Tax=Planomonospora parontospora TaxID=58119 RepID=UPI0016706B54|nr:class I SAM-dependent methyltransferase [Planomonospora parontospora]GGL48900.1 methyltransferase [Planomonospora parontospora subsp. antibiotica]GII18908.1 methyltransferase [Planomonospora parontospora subsp. antibiotica]
MEIYHGTGPGPITPDGCAVDYYATLAAGGEPGLIHAAVPPGAAILELGAGAGRITRPLLELGHEVVAVDESPEMLAHITGAETVCSPIQSLALSRTFDLVLLMSFVVETADDDLRAAFLDTCRRHVADDGCVILQRKPPEWYDTVRPSERRTGDGGTVRMKDISRPGPGLLKATMEYVVGERRWTHTFVSRRLDDDRLGRELGRAGLTLSGFLDGDREWVRAVPR